MTFLVEEELVKKFIIGSRYLRNYRHKNMAQERVIELLGQSEHRMSQKSIQIALGIRPGSVSELISKLENRGLVERVRSEEDKRAMDIVLTEKGKEEFKIIASPADEYKGLFSALTGEEATQLNHLLDKLERDWMNREPSLLENQTHGAKIVVDQEGNYDVDLSHDYDSPILKHKPRKS